MKKNAFARNLTAVSLMAAAVVGICAGWVGEPRDVQFTGKVEARQAVNLAGGWSIAGTNVGVSATELNASLSNCTATADELNGAADISATVAAVKATNGAPVTLSAAYRVYALSGEGQASGSTNTVNFVQPFPVGLTFVVYSKATSTNYVVFIDGTTTNALAGDLTLSARDAAIFQVAATNLILQVGSSNND